MIVSPSYYRCGCRSNDKIWLRRLRQIREGIFPACLCLSGNIHLLSLAFSHIFENSKLTVITMYFFPTLAHQYTYYLRCKIQQTVSNLQTTRRYAKPYGLVASLAALPMHRTPKVQSAYKVPGLHRWCVSTTLYPITFAVRGDSNLSAARPKPTSIHAQWAQFQLQSIPREHTRLAYHPKSSSGKKGRGNPVTTYYRRRT